MAQKLSWNEFVFFETNVLAEMTLQSKYSLDSIWYSSNIKCTKKMIQLSEGE